MVDTKMTKSAGEHWVCSVLSRLNWGAALTRDGLERTDILAVRADDSRQMIEVQVKTATGATDKTSWPLGSKSQLASRTDREWFVLVALPADVKQAPRSFVVPRDVVAAAAWISHQDWLTSPDAEPGKRNAPVDRSRVLLPIWASYEDRWDLIDKPTTDAPVLLPPRYRELALDSRVGLPVGHPWLKELPVW